MFKILMVDDEKHLEILIRQKFRKEIKDGVYEFAFAHNGRDALDRMTLDKDISLVISDINMPEMDGLTLLDHLDKTMPEIKVIIASAYNDVDNVKAAMDRGAYDFITKPLDLNELKNTLQKIKDQTGLSRQEITQLKKSRPSLEKEMAAASKLQLSILPTHFLDQEGIQLYATTTAAMDVGGDFYDYFWISPSKLGVLVADVSGKGISAALFMGMARTLIKLTAMEASSPMDCLTKVNKKILDDNKLSMFVTLFYGILNIQTGDFAYANGGHYPPYLLTQNGCQPLDMPKGTVLGIMESPDYGEKQIHLNSDSTLFLYTDGITEALNRNDVAFSNRRLEEALERHKKDTVKELVEGIVTDVKAFANPMPQYDDITCLALRYAGHA